MSDVHVSVHIHRRPDVVRRWWTEFPEVYDNTKEQPHRIVTRSRDAHHMGTPCAPGVQALRAQAIPAHVARGRALVRSGDG